jgi:hypothetical protein
MQTLKPGEAYGETANSGGKPVIEDMLAQARRHRRFD